MELEKERVNKEEDFNFFSARSPRVIANENLKEIILGIFVLCGTYIFVNYFTNTEVRTEYRHIQKAKVSSMYTEKDHVLFEAKTNLLILKGELSHNENLSYTELANASSRLNETKEHILDLATLEGQISQIESKMLNEIILDIDEITRTVKKYKDSNTNSLSKYQKYIVLEKVNSAMNNVSLAERFAK